jgi:hypothetical protein
MNTMKTTTIKMSQVKGKNAFAGAVWKNVPIEQQEKIFASIGKAKRSVKQTA